MRASPNRGPTDTKFIMPKCRNKREAIAAHEFDRTEKPRPLRQGPGLDLPTAAKPRLVRRGALTGKSCNRIRFRLLRDPDPASPPRAPTWSPIAATRRVGSANLRR